VPAPTAPPITAPSSGAPTSNPPTAPTPAPIPAVAEKAVRFTICLPIELEHAAQMDGMDRARDPGCRAMKPYALTIKRGRVGIYLGLNCPENSVDLVIFLAE
jgi:hypothetical protein